jgi:hypothetical protein
MTASANPVPPASDRYLTLSVLMTSIGTPATFYVAAPVAGKVVYISSCLDVAVNGDNTITAGIGSGTPTAITGVSLVHLSAGSAAGQVLVAKPTGANTVTRGDPISVTTDGGGSAGQTRITIVIEQF